MLQTKVVEKIRTHISSLVTSPLPPPPENSAVYDAMRNNTVKADRPRVTIWRMRNECWVRNVVNTFVCNTYWYSTATMVARTRRRLNPYRTNVENRVSS